MLLNPEVRQLKAAKDFIRLETLYPGNPIFQHKAYIDFKEAYKVSFFSTENDSTEALLQQIERTMNNCAFHAATRPRPEGRTWLDVPVENLVEGLVSQIFKGMNESHSNSSLLSVINYLCMLDFRYIADEDNPKTLMQVVKEAIITKDEELKQQSQALHDELVGVGAIRKAKTEAERRLEETLNQEINALEKSSKMDVVNVNVSLYSKDPKRTPRSQLASVNRVQVSLDLEL